MAEQLTQVFKEEAIDTLRMVIEDLTKNSETYKNYIIEASVSGGTLAKYIQETTNVGSYLETQYTIDEATLEDIEKYLGQEDLLKNKHTILKLRDVLSNISDMKVFFEYEDHVRKELEECEDAIRDVLYDLKNKRADPSKVKEAVLKCDRAIGKVDHRVFGIRKLFENTTKKLREEHKLVFRPI